MLNKSTFFWYNKKTSYDQKGQGFGFMNYSINYSSFSSVFALPTLSEQTLCIASGQALRVLLYLMQHQAQMKTIQPQYLADRLLLDVSQVLEALDFWAGEGILNRDSSGASGAANDCVHCTTADIPTDIFSCVAAAGFRSGEGTKCAGIDGTSRTEKDHGDR